MKIDVLAMREAGEVARDQWFRLAESLGVNPSLQPEWVDITARSHALEHVSELVTATDTEGNSCVLPVYVTPVRYFGVGLKSLQLLTNVVSYHNEFISQFSPETTLDILVEIARQAGADVIQLSGIADDTETGTCLNTLTEHPEVLRYSLPGESSPYLPLKSDWTDLLADKPKKFRYKARKRIESLEHTDQLTMRWYSSADDCPALLSAMEQIENHSWKKSAGVAIFDNEIEARYHRNLLPALSAKNALLANVLFHEQTPIAYNLCCHWAGWVGQMKTSFDARFANLSPGGLVIDKAIQQSIDAGASEFDFLGDIDPHKLAWTKHVRPHADHFLFLRSSLKGRLVGRIKQLQTRLKR